MKERPILFSEPMVRAILEGRKAQTRRLVKPQPEFLQHHEYRGKVEYDGANRRWCWRSFVAPDCWSIGWEQEIATLCPHGVPGDRLWVREAFAYCRIASDHEGKDRIYSCHRFDSDRVLYRADTGLRDDLRAVAWRPSIHMPRWASRITLEITEIRVQRLQDISTEDAIAEGVPCSPVFDEDRGIDGQAFPRREFFDLWDSIYGEGVSKENPWVWAISFKREM